tara:strand:- start:7229 stop:7885 length:657 start_codon:yes stop_codon:yes gene_type:complete
MRNLQEESLKSLVVRYHQGDDCKELSFEIERRFEIPGDDDVSLSELSALHKNYGLSNYVYEGTTLAEAREIFRSVDLSGESLFFDIGAGYGALVLYGAALAPATFVAVEAVGKRADHIARMAARLGLKNIRVVNDGAAAVNHAQASHIYLNNPFLGGFARDYVDRLAGEIGRECIVIALNNIVADFRRSDRFLELETRADIPSYRFGLFAASGPASRA